MGRPSLVGAIPLILKRSLMGNLLSKDGEDLLLQLLLLQLLPTLRLLALLLLESLVLQLQGGAEVSLLEEVVGS